MAANKVKFGLKNVHYALVTETVVTTGADAGKTVSSYGDLKALAGAVSLSLSSSASGAISRSLTSSLSMTMATSTLPHVRVMWRSSSLTLRSTPRLPQSSS